MKNQYLPLFLVLCLRAGAMDVDWPALGMIESGNDDYAIGKAGERSQWQILPSVVREWGFDAKRLTNAPYALNCCKKVMGARERHAIALGFDLTSFNLALLWRCPARLRHPTPADRDYAQRYANLCLKLKK